MAIDDNTSYELTGAQVKDLANKIKAKAADNIFVGATSAAPGSKGLVPQPQGGDDTKFLAGDGTWKTVSSGSNLTILYADDPGGPFWDNKLYRDYARTTAVTHTELNTIVLSGMLAIYDIDGDELFTMAEGIMGGIAYFVGEAGKGFEISPDITDQTHLLYTYTDTSLREFEGATSSQKGSDGLVPAPRAGDQDKVLHGDGTWKTIQSGSSKRTLTWENGEMYDEDYNVISGGDVYTALQSGEVEVVNLMSSLIIEYGIYAQWVDPTYGTLSDVFFFTTERTSLTGAMTRTQYLYDETNGWLTPRTMNIQEQLTAGSNISISGNTISANVKLVEMSYGESNAWAKFIAAYNAGSIVYCRASSNADPGTGSQTRKAFMAYVNNAANPTSVEFQYVRSQSSKTDSQQCDQVFVYTLKNTSGGQWSVASRDMAPKINVSGAITKTFTSGANATITIGANAMTGATSSTAGAAGVVPKPNSGDQNKVLTGAGTWTDLAGSYSTSEVATPYTWVDGKTIYKQTFVTSNITQTQFYVTHGISNFGALVKAEGVMYTANQGYQPLDRVLPSLMSTWGWGLGDVGDTTFALFFGSGYVLSQITTWITLYYTKSS